MEAGRELDALVAEKVMGWHRFLDTSYHPAVPMWYGVEDGWDRWQDEVESWQPSTSIAVAWKVVDEMRRRGYALVVNAMSDVPGGRQFPPLDRYVVWFDNPEGCEITEAATMPLAICLAALKSVAAVGAPAPAPHTQETQ